MPPVEPTTPLPSASSGAAAARASATTTDPEALPLHEASRKLASIQRIAAVARHPDADRLEIATVQGWQCVIGAGEFALGELVVFLEVDAQVPTGTPWAANSAGRTKWRVRTLKLRGVVSQGLCVPLATLNAPVLVDDGSGKTVERPQEDEWDLAALREGMDMTGRLGVTKWVAPEEEDGDGDEVVRGQQVRRVRTGPGFPEDVVGLRKTDELRVQSEPTLVKELAGRPWVATLKVDGMSATFLVHPGTGKFMACSRNIAVAGPTAAAAAAPATVTADAGAAAAAAAAGNDAADAGSAAAGDETADAAATAAAAAAATVLEDTVERSRDLEFIRKQQFVWRAVYTYRIMHKLTNLGGGRYAVQGEVYGPSIQKNRLAVPQNQIRFAVFSVFDLHKSTYLRHHEVASVLKTLQLPMVDVVASGDSFDHSIPSLLQLAQGNYPNTKYPREGIVIRSTDDGPHVSFKVINNDFLLKEK